MKREILIAVILSFVVSACGIVQTPAPTSTATSIPTSTSTATQAPTNTPIPSPTPTLPPQIFGPSNFPAGMDPLTGLMVSDPNLLNRRPMVIKVQNLPRSGRPQWGLSLADIVFEYYSEEGATRFAAIFYGNNASMVGPIRSGRLADIDIVEGYKATFTLGSADATVYSQFLKSDFADRMIIEGTGKPLTRYDPNGNNYLVVNTADLSAYATQAGINARQDENGMIFASTPPSGGQPGTQAFVRYSGVIYNRWDYDPSTGSYLRFADNADDYNNNNEVYLQSTDRLTNQPVALSNVVVLFAQQPVYSSDSNGNKIYSIILRGTGDAYAFRDGQAYQAKWTRNGSNVVTLTNPDGSPFAFKPGNTWFEVVGASSTIKQNGASWRFTHFMP